MVALNCKSAFSFMGSLLKPEALVKLAKAHGCKAVAMTDANLRGAVECFIEAKNAGIKPIIAVMAEGKSFIAYVKDATGYQNLCAALSQPSRALDVGQREGLILRPAEWLPEVRYADPSLDGYPDRNAMGFVEPRRIQVKLLKPDLALALTWRSVSFPRSKQSGGK
jgi:hypothetical protein